MHVGVAAARWDGACAERPGQNRGEAYQPAWRDIRAEGHDHAELDAGGRGYRLRANADDAAAGAVPRATVDTGRAQLCAHAGAARWRARESEYAVLDRRLTAVERDVA